MDSFESLVASLLRRQGYWVEHSFKVVLTKADKAAIGRPSSPRWELDLIAYKGSKNEVLVVECKSFLDSTGVTARHFSDAKSKGYKRFKLFNDATLRRVVIARLKKQLVSAGLCRLAPTVQLCLAAGRIPSPSEIRTLGDLFRRRGWQLWDADWLRERLREIALGGYDDQVGSVVAKLLLRD